MLGKPAKRDDRIVGHSEANRKAVDFTPIAIGRLIIAQQRFRQAMTDNLAVQIVEIPIVLQEQRASFPLDLDSVVVPVHTDEFYPIEENECDEILPLEACR